MIYPTISTGSCSSSLALLTLTRPGKNLVEELDISKSLGFAGSVSFCCVQYCPTRWWCPRSSVRSVGVYNPLFFVSDVVLGSGFLTTEIQKFRSSAASGCQDGGGRSCQEDSFKGLRWAVDVEGEIMMWKLGLYQLHEEKIETYAKKKWIYWFNMGTSKYRRFGHCSWREDSPNLLKHWWMKKDESSRTKFACQVCMGNFKIATDGLIMCGITLW